MLFLKIAKNFSKVYNLATGENGLANSESENFVVA